MKGGRALRRLDDAEPAAGACADEQEASAAAQRLRDETDGAGDRGQLAVDGADGLSVLVVHEPQEARDGQAIQVVAAGVGLFRRQACVMDRVPRSLDSFHSLGIVVRERSESNPRLRSGLPR